MKSVAFLTLGCRVNQYETEAISEAFINDGYLMVDFEEKADVYVINTCTVTNMGDKKSRQMIRKAKKKNPQGVIVVAGCYSQVAPGEVAAIEGVDIIVGTSGKSDIPRLVEEYLESRSQINNVQNIMDIKRFEEMEIDEYQDRTRAFLKIQDGCDRYCSYCLIPYARGHIRSRSPENIIHEVEKLAANGFKEIILSGIHVASYGKDIGGITLTDIIEKISAIAGIERIRIGSIDPTFFDDNTVNRLGKVENLCPHFHLSLQSGCNETLKRMNRHYTTEEYKAIVEDLRKTIPDVSVTTDVIVGFPGETEDEFETTYSFLQELALSKMHVFKFSPRKGTRAAEMDNQIDTAVKDKRSHRVIELDEQLENRFISSFIGRDMKVLFEETKGGYSYGYTENYIRVRIPTAEELSGKILNVRLVACTGELADGELWDLKL
jgi:threonylcarbamoyladenosine tRNA methylthiotransferase MtaB